MPGDVTVMVQAVLRDVNQVRLIVRHGTQEKRSSFGAILDYSTASIAAVVQGAEVSPPRLLKLRAALQLKNVLLLAIIMQFCD